MSNEENAKQWLEDCGQAATIRILPSSEGVQISLSFGEDKVDMSRPTIIQTLALVGCEALRKAVREHFDVQSETVERQPRKSEAN